MSATDELRSMAESVGLAMPQAATLMMGAADAIDRLDAENVKLRELVRDYHIYEHSDCYSCHFYDECHGVGCESRVPFCIAPVRLGERTRELGVEVG